MSELSEQIMFENNREKWKIFMSYVDKVKTLESFMEKMAGALRQAIGTHGELCKERSECDCVKYCLSVLEEYMKHKEGK